jgi:hypothetical protein
MLALASRLKQANEVVGRLNKIGKKEMVQYDKNTKLRTFAEGDCGYLKEMTRYW